MINALRRNYPGPGGMFALSFICHLVVFLVIAYWHILPQFHEDETPVTYVDMVTLPVASPQSGTPAPSQQESKAPAAPAPAPPAPAAPAMALPTKPAAKAPTAKAKAEQQKEAAEAKAFNERMAKMERQADDRRQAAALDALKKKGSARTGMPGGKGTQAGSDYSSYLQSRLKDALKETMAMQAKAPQVMATITVSPDGYIDYHVEKPSGDPLFDDAVRRAVTLAGKTLVPPPNGAYFKRVFRFRPEGVGIK
ncbi:TonB C-terminal domain-containing protein [Geomonas ferrireducens]|uniref:TonB C-terminal domain-containing protein n=1 Tax=Geomonas ferrireducens TaxID=2570227 RepID=UPI0010A78C67|nr:TonB C-terminal domain-containing protein [Geomonas ferrireducens]